MRLKGFHTDRQEENHCGGAPRASINLQKVRPPTDVCNGSASLPRGIRRPSPALEEIEEEMHGSLIYVEISSIDV